MPLEFSYLFCPSMGLPACFRVLSNVFPPTLPLSCGFETPAVLLAVAFTASPPLMMAADMAAPRMVKGKCYAMSTSSVVKAVVECEEGVSDGRAGPA